MLSAEAASDETGTRRPHLLLVRHGRSVHRRSGGWMTPAGVRRWRDAYDQTGIPPHEVPPSSLVTACRTAGLVVSSDLPRAVTSAARLAGNGPVESSPLLRETPLPVPAWNSVTLPLVVWEALIHLRWLQRIVRNVELPPAELARAGTAAAWLTALAQERSPVVVVTHGVFRRLLASRLQADGWRAASAFRPFGYWSVWQFHQTR